MALVKQKTLRPTRKVFAVIVAGAVVGGTQAVIKTFWPDSLASFENLAGDLDIWIQTLVMILAGYMTKEKADDVQNAG